MPPRCFHIWTAEVMLDPCSCQILQCLQSFSPFWVSSFMPLWANPRAGRRFLIHLNFIHTVHGILSTEIRCFFFLISKVWPDFFFVSFPSLRDVLLPFIIFHQVILISKHKKHKIALFTNPAKFLLYIFLKRMLYLLLLKLINPLCLFTVRKIPENLNVFHSRSQMKRKHTWLKRPVISWTCRLMTGVVYLLVLFAFLLFQ